MRGRLLGSSKPSPIEARARRGLRSFRRPAGRGRRSGYNEQVNLGPTELIIILVIVMLLFGASRLPKLARSLGEASKEFKDGVKQGGKEAAEAESDATKRNGDKTS